MSRTEAVLSNADLAEDGDTYTMVTVKLRFRVNVSAYKREYGDYPVLVRDIKDDVRDATIGTIENSDMFPGGVLTDVEMY